MKLIVVNKHKLKTIMPIEELTVAQWEEVYEGWNLEEIEQILSQREGQIRSLMVRLYYCPTNIRPLI
jgi:hypothetical protein